MAASEATVPPEAPAPKPGGRKKLLVLVLVAVIVVAAVGIGLVILLGSPSHPSPGPTSPALDHVTVSVQNGAASLDPSATLSVTAAAFDTSNAAETSNASFAWSANPAADLSITHPGAAKSSAQIEGLHPGTVTLTVTATWENSTKSASVTLVVNPLLLQETPNNVHPTIGSPFLIALRVAHADNTTDTTFNGTIHFASSDTSGTIPPDLRISPADLGVLSISGFVVNVSSATTITASDALFGLSGSAVVYGNHPPTAFFTVSPSASNPAQVTLNATGSTDPDSGETLSYIWTYGDGNSAQKSNPVSTYTYGTTGAFTIVLVVQDNYGASGSYSRQYTVHTPPTASFSIKGETATGTAIMVTFDASASTGGDGSLVSYAWVFGDGSGATRATPISFHNYSMSYNGQNVTVSLTVTNNYSLSNVSARKVAVSTSALPPIAAFAFVINNYTRAVSVNGSASSSQTGQPIAYYDWAWGDGSPDTNTSSPSAAHTYASDATFAITLTVVDTLNLKDSVSHSAVVKRIEVAPVALFIYARNGLSVVTNASGTFDLNGNLAWLTWSWGDGSPALTVPASQVMAGHTYGSAGLYVITLVANDTTNLKSTATRDVSVATSTLDYTFSDFFNVPYGEWWDLRTAKYGDRPLRTNCFNATSVSDGICSITNTGIPTSETSAPYTDWYPQPAGTGSNSWSHTGNDPLIYAPYRFQALGVNQTGYNVSEPVFLPVLNYAVQPAPTSYVDFSWNMQYLDMATAAYVTGTLGCPLGSGQHYGDDGFMIRSQIDLTMDEKEAARLFGAPDSTNPSTLTAYWSAQSVPCNAAHGFPSTLESNVANWFSTVGNGKYDVYSSFQYAYTPFYVLISATVDSTTLTTHVHIDTSAWGTEALMARWFYWGNASYAANYLNSAAARGWWGMELAWFEDFHFNGGLSTGGMDFSLNTVMEYHFNQLSAPGPDGHLRSAAYPTDSDDVPYWTWGPWLTDYIPTFQGHPSELTRYTSPYSAFTGYLHSTPGTGTWVYGVNATYEFIPTSWAPKAGEQWHFEFPFGNVVFYNPDTSPQPSNPQSTDYQIDLTPVAFWTSYPGNWGGDVQFWNQTAWTWDAFGSTSAPSWPCGCGSNTYPAEPYGAVIFYPQGWTNPGPAPQAPGSATPTLSGPAVASRTALPAAALSPGSWSTTIVALPDLMDPMRVLRPR